MAGCADGRSAMGSGQDCAVHVGTKKSPSGETGLYLVSVRKNRGDSRHYALKQELVIIEISDNGYKQTT